MSDRKSPKGTDPKAATDQNVEEKAQRSTAVFTDEPDQRSDNNRKNERTATQTRSFQIFEDAQGAQDPLPLPESVSGHERASAAVDPSLGSPLQSASPLRWRLRLLCWAMLSILAGIVFVELARAYDYFYALWPGLGVLWLVWVLMVSAGAGAVWWYAVRDERSLRRADDFRERVSAHLIGHNYGITQALQMQLSQFYAGLPQAAQWAEALRTLPDSANDNEVIQHLERVFFAKLDKQAIDCIGTFASRNGMMIALSPWPLLDGILCFSNCFKLMSQIAHIYGLRPGLTMRLQLTRRIISALLLSSGSESLIESLMEEGGMATLSSFSLRVGQGIGIGVYTARIGCFAMAACRPFPFDQCSPPNMRDFLMSLVNKLRG